MDSRKSEASPTYKDSQVSDLVASKSKKKNYIPAKLGPAPIIS